MVNHSDLAFDVALSRHQERLTAAQRQRQVAQARRANKERKALATGQQRASAAPSNDPIRSWRAAGLAHWLVRVGDIVAQYPAAELDGQRRPALGVVVDELLNAARKRGADVPSNTAEADSAVVLLRTLGRLGATTAGRSIPVSRRRGRILQAAVDDLVNGRDVQVTQSRAGRVA